MEQTRWLAAHRRSSALSAIRARARLPARASCVFLFICALKEMNSKLCLHRFTVKRNETTLHESIITLITWVLVTGNVAQSVEGTLGSDSHLGQYFIFHVQTSPKEKQKHFSYFSFDFNCISKVKKEAREKKKSFPSFTRTQHQSFCLDIPDIVLLL